MNNEVRKPREFWISLYEESPGIAYYSKEHAQRTTSRELLHAKEILPGDDSIRVSREDWDILKIQCAMNSGSGWDLMERIERESKGE